MNVTCDADLIILGGGCAGLSLARNLARGQSGPRAVVLEAREQYGNDRTWCFWAGQHHDDAHLVGHRWEAWEFSTDTQTAIQKCRDGTSYQCIAADSFYHDAIRIIERSDRVFLRLGTRAEDVTDCGSYVEVQTSEGVLHARWLVDTRPRPAGHDRGQTLNQVFVGAEVRTEHEVFDSTVAGLMTHMSVDDLGFRFTYVLPFSKRQALLEETRFAHQSVPRARLVADLNRTLSELNTTVAVETLRTEEGCIPMTTASARLTKSGRIVHAGTSGGAVRASSGYAFARIQKWAADCASELNAGAGPLGHPPDPAWRAAVDRLFLTVLRAQPELTPTLFMALGKHLTAKTLVRFLSDECRPRDFARVAWVLPKRPFLRELLLGPKRGGLL